MGKQGVFVGYSIEKDQTKSGEESCIPWKEFQPGSPWNLLIVLFPRGKKILKYQVCYNDHRKVFIDLLVLPDHIMDQN